MNKKGADFKVIVAIILGVIVLLSLLTAFSNTFSPFNNEISNCPGQCVAEDTGCSFPAVQRTGSPCKMPGQDPDDGSVCCVSPGNLTSDSND